MIPMGRMGLGGIILLLVIAYFGRGLFSGGGSEPEQPAPSPTSGATPRVGTSDQDDQVVQFVSFVLDDAQRTWDKKLGSRYHHAKLVLFSDMTQTECGRGAAAMGPFYCPLDEKVYLDLGFFRELDRRFGAPGDFAQAYVIAHELGHHVQKLLGIEAKMREAAEQRPRAANDLSIRLELQADCFAGVWGASTAERKLLDPGDIDEGLRAAAAVGDDRIQRQTTGRVTPETWTHGSAEQRSRWLRRGLDSGDISACDTFGSGAL